MQAARRLGHGFRFRHEGQALTEGPEDGRKALDGGVMHPARQRHQDHRGIERPMHQIGGEGFGPTLRVDGCWARLGQRPKDAGEADQEGGQVQHLKGSGFDTMPSAVAQGQMSADTLRSSAKTWGGQLKQAGINVDLAPVLGTVQVKRSSNAPIGALNRLMRSAVWNMDMAYCGLSLFVLGLIFLFISVRLYRQYSE